MATKITSLATVSRIREADYVEANDSFTGWCTFCNAFTRECTEPDAEGYDCPVCRRPDVVGAEQALLMGLFEFEEE